MRQKLRTMMKLRKYKRRLLPSLLLLLFPFSSTQTLSASTFEKQDEIQITNLQNIDDDYYAYGRNLQLDGVINGDFSILMSNSATLSGRVVRSANIISEECTHAGVVSGSLRVIVSQQLNVTGTIEGSALAMGKDLTFKTGSVVQRDVTLFGTEVVLAGTIKGGVLIRASRVDIRGFVGGDVKIHANKIRISPPAVILGSFRYTSEKKENLVIDSGVTVAGVVEWQPSESDKVDGELKSSLSTFIFRISALLAAFLFGLIAVYLFRPYAVESYNQLRNRTVVSLAAGFVGLIALMLIFVVLVVSIVLLITGFVVLEKSSVIGSLVLIVGILMLPISGFAGVSGAIIFYSGEIIAAYVLGTLLLRKTKNPQTRLNNSSLLIGLIVLTALFSVPYIGELLFLMVSIAGAGAIILGIKHGRPKVAGGESSV
ncbi:MAG: hypothetical protein SGI97_03710 [candidate division Zixibacteria bacterium]|nr:hypothetical protein [candidate division Zixibacteria bacterium]